MQQKRIIVGISGASGAIYGIELLKALKAASVETHLVITRSAQITIAHETDYSSPQGEETFDFAKPGHAFGYYGGLQLSSLAMAFGLGMLVHGTVRPRRAAHRRRTIVATPGPLGIGLSGRF